MRRASSNKQNLNTGTPWPSQERFSGTATPSHSSVSLILHRYSLYILRIPRGETSVRCYSNKGFQGRRKFHRMKHPQTWASLHRLGQTHLHPIIAKDEEAEHVLKELAHLRKEAPENSNDTIESMEDLAMALCHQENSMMLPKSTRN